MVALKVFYFGDGVFSLFIQGKFTLSMNERFKLDGGYMGKN